MAGTTVPYVIKQSAPPFIDAGRYAPFFSLETSYLAIVTEEKKVG